MKKDINIKVRITTEERKRLDNICKKLGVSKSFFIRNVVNLHINTKTLNQDSRKELKDLTYHIFKIGTNINQIAHYFNLEHLRISQQKKKSVIQNTNYKQLLIIRKLLKVLNSKLNKTINFLNKAYEEK